MHKHTVVCSTHHCVLVRILTVFGQAITDPVDIVSRRPNTFVLIVGAITFVVATIGINIVANFVSPAYDLANVAPKYINFQRGGFIAAMRAER